MLDIFDLKGKKAIVTGSGQGMGNSVANIYCKGGADVVLMDIRNDIDEIAKGLASEHSVRTKGIQVDLGKSGNRNKAFDEAIEYLGGIDILVNCAGIQFVEDSVDFTQEDWHRVLSVNLDAVFELSQMAARIMIPQKSGKIINFASMLSFIGGSRVPAYAASKGAVMQITKTMSNEWAKYNINVNAIAPGYMDTALNTKFMANKERSEFILSRIPASRWGQPNDIDGLAVLLATRASDYMTGITIPVDGGFLAN